MRMVESVAIRLGLLSPRSERAVTALTEMMELARQADWRVMLFAADNTINNRHPNYQREKSRHRSIARRLLKKGTNLNIKIFYDSHNQFRFMTKRDATNSGRKLASIDFILTSYQASSDSGKAEYKNLAGMIIRVVYPAGMFAPNDSNRKLYELLRAELKEKGYYYWIERSYRTATAH